MIDKQKIILPESDEAAKHVTLTGWLSRNGLFFDDGPEAERIARNAGATHRRCDCGTIFKSVAYTACDECREKLAAEKHKARPAAEWNGVDPIYSDAADEWFCDEDEIADYCRDNDTTPDDLRLIIGEPELAKEIDPKDHYADDLQEDGEVPAEIADAFTALNAAIRACKKPLCWYPGKFAVKPGSIEVES